MSNPTALTDTDQSRVAIACKDTAHTYAALGAARYVSEVLSYRALNAYTYETVREAVGAYLADHPEVLTYTEQQVTQHQAARSAASEAAASKASDLWLAGDPAEATTVIDAASVANPEYRVDGRYSWAMLRNIIETQEPNS